MGEAGVEASGLHRCMVNHPSISQEEWNEGASMNLREWTQHVEFLAFPSQIPGTKRIVVVQAHSPHLSVFNHPSKTQEQWNEGAKIEAKNFSPQLEFWAYTDPQPGTIRMAVGDARNPYRSMINHQYKTQEEWNNGASMSMAGWSHCFDFWVFPVTQEQ